MAKTGKASKVASEVASEVAGTLKLDVLFLFSLFIFGVWFGVLLRDDDR